MQKRVVESSAEMGEQMCISRNNASCLSSTSRGCEKKKSLYFSHCNQSEKCALKRSKCIVFHTPRLSQIWFLICCVSLHLRSEQTPSWERVNNDFFFSFFRGFLVVGCHKIDKMLPFFQEVWRPSGRFEILHPAVPPALLVITLHRQTVL